MANMVAAEVQANESVLNKVHLLGLKFDTFILRVFDG